MSGKKRVNYGILLLTLIFTLSFTIPGFADNNTRVAKVTEFKGDVKVKKAGGEKTFAVFKSMALAQGDRIMTGKASTAVLDLDGDKEVRIAENTQIVLSELVKSAGNTKTTMNLLGGKIVINVKKKLTKDSKFQIKTPTAVMGVRGTRFFVSHEGNKTRISVLEGTVVAATYAYEKKPDGTTEEKKIEVAITPGKETTLDDTVKSKEDVKVEEVSPEELDIFALQAIKADPQGIAPEMLKDIDQIIEQKQKEQQEEQKKKEQQEGQKSDKSKEGSNIIYDDKVPNTGKSGSDSSGQEAPSIILPLLSNMEIMRNESKSFSAAVLPADATLSAVSDNPSIAEVVISSSVVIVKGKLPGTTTIRVTGSRTGYTSTSRNFTVIVKDFPAVKLDAVNDFQMNQGDTHELTISGAPEGACLHAVSSNTAAVDVVVSQNKLTVIGKAPGVSTLTVTASKDGFTEGYISFAVTVVELPTVNIQTINDVALNEGSSKNIAIVTNPEDAQKTVQSSNTAVATAELSADTLLLTAKGIGSSVITVTAKKAGYKEAHITFTVTVNELPTINIQVINDIALNEGTSKNISIVSNPQDAQKTVQSSNTAVATAELSGDSLLLTAKGIGSTVITVTAKKAGYTDAHITFTVTVNELPTINIQSINDIAIYEGATRNISIATNPQDAQKTVQSSNTAVVTAEMSGDNLLLTANSIGSSVIAVTAKKAGYAESHITFNVTVNALPTVNIEAINDITINEGESQYVSIVTNPEDAVINSVSSGGDTALIEQMGKSLKITGKAAGSVVVTVSAGKDGYSSDTASFKVTVNAVPKNIIINPVPYIQMYQNGIRDISIVTNPQDADKTVQSSNCEVVQAELSENTLKLTARAVGNATITVTAKKPGYIDEILSFQVEIVQMNQIIIEPIGNLDINKGDVRHIPIISGLWGISLSVESQDENIAKAYISDRSIFIEAIQPGMTTIKLNANMYDFINACVSFTVTVKSDDADTIPPYVTKVSKGQIGDGSPAVIEFSEPLSPAAKEQVQKAICYGTTCPWYLNFYWYENDSKLRVSINSSVSYTDFANDIKADISDIYGNTSSNVTLIALNKTGKLEILEGTNPTAKIGDSLTIVLKDPDMDVHPKQHDIVGIEIATESGAYLYMELRETANGSGVFKGNIIIGEATDKENCIIKGQPGDQMMVSYHDERNAYGYDEYIYTSFRVVTEYIQTSISSLNEGYGATDIEINCNQPLFTTGNQPTTLTIFSPVDGNVTGASTITIVDSTHIVLHLAEGLKGSNIPYGIILTNCNPETNANDYMIAPLLIKDCTEPHFMVYSLPGVKVREYISAMLGEEGYIYVYDASQNPLTKADFEQLISQNKAVVKEINSDFVFSSVQISTTGLNPGSYKVRGMDKSGNLTSGVYDIAINALNSSTDAAILDDTSIQNIDYTNHVITVALGTTVGELMSALIVDSGKGRVLIYMDKEKYMIAYPYISVNENQVLDLLAEDGYTRESFTIKMGSSKITNIEIINDPDKKINIDNDPKSENYGVHIVCGKTVEYLKNGIRVDGGRGSFKIYTDSSRTQEATADAEVADAMVIVVMAEDGKTERIYKIIVHYV